MNTQITRLAVFGSTGSIGKSALDVVRKYPERFKVTTLVANSNIDILEKQIKEFKPQYAGLSDVNSAEKLKARIDPRITRIFSGGEVSELAAFDDYDLMLAAVVGFSGLESVLKAVRGGKRVALANKESLVAAGELLLKEVSLHNSEIIPVDSEHSAIFQLLEGRKRSDISSITLTASGGPFFKRDLKDFENITPQEALKHPRWSMGNKVSLDSATMFNKALELMEAKWLFDLSPEKISVVVHPQSIIHSMVNFNDGTTFAQLSATDMKGPIAYAMNYPEDRLSGVLEPLDFAKVGSLEFYEVDKSKFPAIELARSVFGMGKAAGSVLNTANEYAGAAFLEGKISFTAIYSCVNDALSQFGSLNYSTYEDLIDINRQVKQYLEKDIIMESR